MTPNMIVCPSAPRSTENVTMLKDVWKTINEASCPYQYNFHLHTVYSDGQMIPEDLIDQAIFSGLKGLAITDHHSVKGYQAANRYLNSLRENKTDLNLPQLWTGIEITSQLKGIEVHILGYAFNPNHPSMANYLTGDKPQGEEAKASLVIQSIHDAGGLVVLAHPNRYHRPADELIRLGVKFGIDGAEAYYAYGNPKPWIPSQVQTQQVKKLCEKYHIFATCGTDSHGLSLLYRL